MFFYFEMLLRMGGLPKHANDFAQFFKLRNNMKVTFCKKVFLNQTIDERQFKKC